MLTSCASLVGDLRENYTLDLQHGFEKSKVEVFADDRMVFRGTVTTESCIGLAHRIPDTGPCFTITVKVRHRDGKAQQGTTRPNRRGGWLIGMNAHTEGLLFEQFDGTVYYY